MKLIPYFVIYLFSLFASLAEAKLTFPVYHGSQRVLFVGDSLSVGPFGREIQAYLNEEFTDKRVYLYASCGSSPEHWLPEEPSFTSKCGCRVKTPSRTLHYEYERGRPPEAFATPKLDAILKESRPSIVIVQLGTNWFDLLEAKSAQDQVARLEGILDRFALYIKSSNPNIKLVWVTPPDSERFRRVQGTVTNLIRRAARMHRFEVVDSSKMVRYTTGESGGDGVHYYGPDALKWADGVKRRLQSLL